MLDLTAGSLFTSTGSTLMALFLGAVFIHLSGLGEGWSTPRSEMSGWLALCLAALRKEDEGLEGNCVGLSGS